jgi:DNA-binding CsgD family transcriptional regulator
MDGTASATFQHAARFEHDLTDRQRDVLRLIAAGKTNSQIAESLDMTLAGAKWHVSEVLSKLGLDSREAAADYYRWRQSPLHRLSGLARGIVPATAWKLGLAGVGAAAAVAAAVSLVLSQSHGAADLGPAEPGLPFSMESTLIRTDDHTVSQANRRYWYQDASNQRIDLASPKVTHADPGYETAFGPDDAVPSTVVISGTKRMQGDARHYTVGAAPPLSVGLEGTALGPLPDASIEDFAVRTAAVLTTSGESSADVIRLGRSSLLGRRVEVVEFIRHDAAGNNMGSQKFWIDADRMLVLRHELVLVLPADSGQRELRQTEAATRLNYGSVDRDALVFVPAPGAVPITCSSPPPSASSTFQAPFLVVPNGLLPGGLAWLNYGVTAGDSGACDTATAEYAANRGPGTVPIALSIKQYTTVPAGFVDSGMRAVDLNGTSVSLGPDAHGNERLALVFRGVAVEFRSSTLSEAVLLELAEAVLRANP